MILNWRHIVFPLLAGGWFATAASNCTAAPQQDPANTDTNRQAFQVKGVVQELKSDGKTVVIRHEAVPNYMPAMTMPFEVKNTNELRDLKAGDDISFRMIVTPKEGWIDHITRAGTMQVVSSSAMPVVLHEVELLKIGDPLPDYHFTNELGQAVSTARYKGKAVAFTFFFTRCPYPNFCPFLSTSFGDTEKKLLAMANSPTNWQMFSISFDPQFDTAATLHSYAIGYKYDPSHWSFLTGDPAEITALADHFGEYFGHDGAGGITHNLRTVVVDATGRVQKIINGNTWTSDELAAEIMKAAAVKP